MPPYKYHAQRDEPQTRDITARTIEIRSDSTDDANRSVLATIATERVTTVRDMRTYEIIDEVLLARGLESMDDVPLLDNHSRWSLDDVMGSAREISVSGDTITARLFFHADESQPEIERAWKKVKAGHLRNVSAGYAVRDAVEIQPGRTAEVEGKRYTAGRRPLRVATRWALREVSLVPVGADSAARIRKDGGAEMPPKLRAYLESLGLRKDATEAEAWTKYHSLADQQRSDAEALLDGVTPPRERSDVDPVTPPAPSSPPPAPQQPDAEQLRREAVETERRRQADLRGEFGQDAPELLQRAIDEGWTVEQSRPELLRAIRRSRAVPADGRGPAIHSRSHEASCNRDSLQAALCLRHGVALDSPHWETMQARHILASRAGEQSVLTQPVDSPDRQRAMDEAWRYRSMSLVDIAREALRLDGVSCGPGREAVLDALRTSPSSSSQLTSIFTQNLSAQLLMAYMDAPDSTEGWTSSADVPNFQSNERVPMGKFGPLTKHARGSVADHMDTLSQLEEYRIHRYSGKFTVDEQDLIDDRFGAIEQASPSDMGNAAAQLRPDLVYAALLANANLASTSNALFATSHGGTMPSTVGNLGTGVLSADHLQAAISQMAKQRIRSRPLNIRPRYLIVPQDLRFAAEILLQSAQRIIAASSGGTYNPLQGVGLEIRMDDRIGTAGVVDPLTGVHIAGSAANWFLSARPGEAGAKTIEVGYLRDSGRAPVVRSYMLSQGQWGIGWDIKHDIGVKPLDFRGMFKSTGADTTTTTTTTGA